MRENPNLAFKLELLRDVIVRDLRRPLSSEPGWLGLVIESGTDATLP